MIEALISFSVATLALAISPGPDNVYVLTQSLVNGTKSGIATTAGLISGCIVHTTLLAFGISAIITASEELFYGIKVMGACYLIYLAYNVYKTGVIMNLVNPKIMIFFLAFFPGFLWDNEGHTVLQFYILGITFMVISFLVFSSIAVLSGRISNFILKRKGVGAFLKWLQIIVFIGISIYIIAV